MLEAPVSGGVGGATAGTCSAMVGGAPDVIERYRPVLNAMCKTITHVGPVGAGTTMKALNNFLAATSLWAASESLVVGAKSGLDPATMVVAQKPGNSDAVQTKFPRSTLPRTFDYGFSVGLMAKDLAIAAGIARAANADAPLIALQAATWASACEALGFGSDMTAVITLIEKASHFEVPAVPKMQ